MTEFQIDRSRLGNHQLIHLHDRQQGREVTIALRGATVLKIEVTHQGARHDVADGYIDAKELEDHSGSRFAVMAPFANRIAEARYDFEGRSFDLQPGVPEGKRGIRHGFVRAVDFELDYLAATADGAHAVFSTQAIRPQAYAGYPHSIDLVVRYTLNHDGLTLEATMRNVGEQAAPCFFGWHPYLRVGTTPLDSWELQVPAATLIRVDEGSIPLPGDAARAPVESEPEKDFRRSRSIGSIELDQGYTDQQRDADGLVRSTLRDPASGLGVTMWHANGITLGFTSDTVKRDVRKAVALEPMESWTNAYNRPECALVIRLEAGAERRFRCGLTLHTQ